MIPHRIFCDWKSPALDGILRFLSQNYTIQNELNLGECLLVFTGGKAGRRLQEKLALYAQEQNLILTPPVIITTGSLPEKLYIPKVPIASSLESLLARISALIEIEPETVKKIAGLLPEKNNLSAWVGIAKNITNLNSELAADLLTFEVAGEKISELPSAPEDLRWEILAKIQQNYLAELEKVNLIDRHQARIEAIACNQIQYHGTIIFCAVRELNLVTREMIKQVNSPVYALIHAPESESESFDAYGTIITEAWSHRDLNINNALIIPAIDARDQGVAALSFVNSLNGKYHHSEIIIGQTDQKLLPYLDSVFIEAGQKLHDPAGLVLTATRPLRLLNKLRDYLLSKKISDFYELLRFPEIEIIIRSRLSSQGFAEVDSLIAKSDRFQTKHLQSEVLKNPFKLDAEDLYTVGAEQALEDILAPLNLGQKNLLTWIPELQNLILAFYPDALYLQAEIEAMDQIWDLIFESNASLLPTVSGGQALDIFIKLAAEVNIPKERQAAELDTLGWLELQLEDAPVIVVAGMNEGFVPESVNSDPFLPQGVRKHLGLLDNERRYARDAFVIMALINSVPELRFIYAHYDSEGGPILPSRLLVSSKQEDFVAKVASLYLASVPKRALFNKEIVLSELTKWEIPPRPEKQLAPLTSLSVTAFRNYLSCPYRFYLANVLRLADVNDSLIEMDGRLFGNLGHEVLAKFIRCDQGVSSKEDNIKSKLAEILDQVFLEQFGTQPLPAVSIQREQLRTRLNLFASWQAGWRADGWITKEVEYPEHSKGTILNVDGKDFHVYGRIDRIDYHPIQKIWAVFDYKFGEQTQEPEKTHRKNDDWIDLQLPLYQYILRNCGFKEEMQLGYIRLAPEIQFEKIATFAKWTEEELSSAEAAASEVIRKIRRQEFWPPNEQNYPTDPFAAIMGVSQFVEEVADV